MFCSEHKYFKLSLMLLDKFIAKVEIGSADLRDKVVCFLPIVMFSLIAHWGLFEFIHAFVVYLSRHIILSNTGK